MDDQTPTPVDFYDLTADELRLLRDDIGSATRSLNVLLRHLRKFTGTSKQQNANQLVKTLINIQVPSTSVSIQHLISGNHIWYNYLEALRCLALEVEAKEANGHTPQPQHYKLPRGVLVHQKPTASKPVEKPPLMVLLRPQENR